MQLALVTLIVFAGARPALAHRYYISAGTRLVPAHLFNIGKPMNTANKPAATVSSAKSPHFVQQGGPLEPSCFDSGGTQECSVVLGEPYYLPSTIVNGDGGSPNTSTCSDIVFDKTGNSNYTLAPQNPSILANIMGNCNTVTTDFNWEIVGLVPSYSSSGVTYYTVEQVCSGPGSCGPQRWHWNFGFIVNITPPGPNGPYGLPERPCGRCNGTTIGKPIDVATGELWYQKTDLKMSGPFGLTFGRIYANQSFGSADLGNTNWLHTYSERLIIPASGSGSTITYLDNQGMPFYFGSLTAGSSFYDNYSGMTLSLSSDGTTYTLQSFSNQTWTFNAKGELTRVTDRVGNGQTLARDSTSGHADRILNVSDSLNRKLCFYYDSSNRITTVGPWWVPSASSPCPTTASGPFSSPALQLNYDTGTNCTKGQLCAATEPDGHAWTYQYTTSDPNFPDNLAEVLDPLGNPEEVNTYDPYGDVIHQQSGSSSSIGDSISINYPSQGGFPTITDGLGRTSTVTYDTTSLQLTSISGPICNCGGDQTRAFTYDQFRRTTQAIDDGDGVAKHVVTYGYGRDANGYAYPGPTQITETLTDAGATRVTNLAYYPLGTPQQDLVQTKTYPSVDNPSAGKLVTVANTYSATGLLTQRKVTGYVNGTATPYTWQWSYDTRGRVLSATGPRTDLSQVTRYGYYADTDTSPGRAGQLATVTDALTHVTSLASQAGYAQYTVYGEPESIIDPNGVVTEVTYDPWGRPLHNAMLGVLDDTATLLWQWNYDAAGRLQSVVKPLGNGIAYTFDTADRLVSAARFDASNVQHERITYGYDVTNEVTGRALQTCASGSANCASFSSTFGTAYGYDSNSNLSTMTNFDGTAKKYTFTPQGEDATINDENHPTGSNYSMTYDLAGRKLSESRQLGSGSVTIKYTYDLQDNVASVTDQNGNVTTYHHDDFGHILSEQSPVQGLTTYSYDPAGNLLTLLDSNGSNTTFTYDALNRELSETAVEGAQTLKTSWTYDSTALMDFGIGRLATMTDPSGSTSYTYDRRGNITAEVHTIVGNSFGVAYAYDANGNRTGVAYPDDSNGGPNGDIVDYGFDFADRPYSAVGAQYFNQTSLRLAAARTRGAAFAAKFASLRSTPERPPAGTHPHERSEFGVPAFPAAPAVPRSSALASREPVSAQHGPGSAGPKVIAPARNNALRRGHFTLTGIPFVLNASYLPFGPLASLSLGNGTTQTLTYDSRYRIKENAVHASSGAAIYDTTYTEDAVGNLLTINDTLNANLDRTFAYDDLNRMTTANSGSLLWGTATGNGYTYDALGDIKTIQLGTGRTENFTYLAGAAGSTGLPLIASTLENGTKRNVTYDSYGNVIADGKSLLPYSARELLGSDSAEVQTYYYDGLRRRVAATISAGTRATILDQDDDMLAETTTTTGSPTLAYEYVWFAGRPVAQVDSTGTHWTYADHLGTPVFQTNSAGAASWLADYEPYGRLWSQGYSGPHQPLRFPGQVAEQFDTGLNGMTELSYNGTRWYRPGWGRYDAPDLAGLRGGANLYAYVKDRPDVASDREGLDATLQPLYPTGFPPANVGDSPLAPASFSWQNLFPDYHPESFPQWGNYCGDDWTLGKHQAEYLTPPSAYDAQDAPAPLHGPGGIDDCCRQHDHSLSKCNHPGNGCLNTSWPGKHGCQCNADNKLSSCAVGAAGTERNWYRQHGATGGDGAGMANMIALAFLPGYGFHCWPWNN